MALAIPATLPQDHQIERLSAARSRAVAQLETVQRQLAMHGRSDDAAIFATHTALLSDPALTNQIEARIAHEQLSAEAAVARIVLDLEKQLISSGSSLLQDKAADILDIGQRLIHCLSGLQEFDSVEKCVLVAPSLTPSELVRAAHQGAIAAVTESCGRKSHTAILARGLGMPMVTGITALTSAISSGAEVIVDGERGIAVLDPEAEDQETVDSMLLRISTTESESPPAVAPKTADGAGITLLLNISDTPEAEAVPRLGADGVGLYRTEFFYLDRVGWPSEQESFDQYAAVASAIGGRELNIRLADFGAEKCPPYADIPVNRNPSLGIRGIRLLLSRDDIFRPQVKAIERLARQREITLLLPMVDTFDTLNRATERLCRHCGCHQRAELPFRLGLMVEVPAAAFTIDQLIDKVDAVALGLNDLTQYFLAADRDDDLVESYHDPLQPGLLRLVKLVIDVANARHKPVTMCGELAGDPMLARVLLGLGARRFSVSRSHYHRTASQFHHLVAAREMQRAHELLNAQTGRDIRQLLVSANDPE